MDDYFGTVLRNESVALDEYGRTGGRRAQDLVQGCLHVAITEFGRAAATTIPFASYAIVKNDAILPIITY